MPLLIAEEFLPKGHGLQLTNAPSSTDGVPAKMAVISGSTPIADLMGTLQTSADRPICHCTQKCENCQCANE